MSHFKSLFTSILAVGLLVSCSDEPQVNLQLESTKKEHKTYSLGRPINEAARIASEGISLLDNDNSRSNSRHFDVNKAICHVAKSSRAGEASDTLF